MTTQIIGIAVITLGLMSLIRPAKQTERINHRKR